MSLQAAEGIGTDEAPRERAEKHGVGVLSNAELWALILRTGLTGLPITQLTSRMMNEHDNSLMKLERRTRQERLGIQGIGMVKAIQIEAVYELAKRYFREGPEVKTTIRQSQDIYNYIREQIANLPHEEIWAIYLRNNNTVITRKQLTVGSSTASIFDIKSLMRYALLEKAEGIILCHNHPSGTLQPSVPDRDITRKTAEACKTLSMKFLDHLIVTPHGYYSFHDNGDIL